MVNILFDFDGTLINSQGRLYTLFKELCPECKMTYDEYWEIKRNRVNQKDILSKYFLYDDEKIRLFHELWLKKVEDRERLKLDMPVDGVNDILERLLYTYDLFLVTNRQSEERALEEVSRFKWTGMFSKILVTEQKVSKKELIEREISITPEDVFISDTGEDIKTARELGIKSIAVTWGVLNKNILAEYSPTIIVESVNELENVLL